jgi:hypothetical protein
MARRIGSMADEEKKSITPQAGEFWLRRRFYGGGRSSEAEPARGFVYKNPLDLNQLMFADFHFAPCPVTADMVHGKNNWYRAHPPVE